jgi:hypothetical protein
LGQQGEEDEQALGVEAAPPPVLIGSPAAHVFRSVPSPLIPCWDRAGEPGYPHTLYRSDKVAMSV